MLDDDDVPPTAEEKARVRAKNLRDIRSLYGTGEGPGRAMLLEVMGRYLLDILPDEAIAELAAMHRAHDARRA